MTIKPNTWYKRIFNERSDLYSVSYTTDTHVYVYYTLTKGFKEYFDAGTCCWGTLAEFEGVIAEKGYDVIEIKYADVLLDEI